MGNSFLHFLSPCKDRATEHNGPIPRKKRGCLIWWLLCWAPAPFGFALRWEATKRNSELWGLRLLGCCLLAVVSAWLPWQHNLFWSAHELDATWTLIFAFEFLYSLAVFVSCMIVSRLNYGHWNAIVYSKNRAIRTLRPRPRKKNKLTQALIDPARQPHLSILGRLETIFLRHDKRSFRDIEDDQCPEVWAGR